LPDTEDPAIVSAGAGHWIVDLPRGPLRYSRRAAALFGYGDEAAPRNLPSVLASFVADDRAFVDKAFTEAMELGRIEFQKRIRRADDGALRWLHISGGLVGGDGRPLQMAGSVTDVTAWREQENQLHQHDRMEALGYLCRKIAHDYNNLLMVIGANLEMLNERTSSDDDKASRYFNAAHHAVERGAALNQQLLAFSGRLELRTQNVDPFRTLKAAEEVLRQEAGNAVVMNIVAAPEGSPLCATDPLQLQSAVLTLVRNASDAMPDGGTLTLSISSQEISSVSLFPKGVKHGRFVVISATDTGTGIADDIIDRVFEPLFTTREVRTGKGLGLSRVYGFAKQSGGFVTIGRHLPTGTTVSIHLPQLA
jgi:PAS domain S-box-containing protein